MVPSSKNILVTGVAGFIGSNLAEHLLGEGYRVIGIDNLSYGVREQVPAGVVFHQLDIRSAEIKPVFAGVEAVFHLAAKNCLSDCQADPVETADINVRGTVNVFEASRQAGVQRVIYAESSAVYEGSTIFPTPETELQPIGFYAISKAATHFFAQGYERFGQLNLTGLRYFNVYGPHQDYRRTIPPVMSAFIIKLLKGEAPIIYGTGERRRDFIHVNDINDFHLRCLRDDRTKGKVFNLGSGVNHSVRELYQLIVDLLGLKVQPIFRPALEGEAEQTLADISAARALGWSARIDLHDGLKDMVAYIKAELAKGNIK